MNSFPIIFLALCCLTYCYCADTYSTKYDSIDIDAILKSDRLLKNYIDCVMDRGPCTADGKELKSQLVELVQTGCGKCTEKQKEGMRKVLKHLTTKKKDMWNELKAKYDPEGIYRTKYLQLLKEAGAVDT